MGGIENDELYFIGTLEDVHDEVGYLGWVGPKWASPCGPIF